MWKLPLAFFVFAVISYIFLPTESIFHLSELPVNRTSLAILFSILSFVTFVRDFLDSRNGGRTLEAQIPPAVPHGASSKPPPRTMRGVIIQHYGEDSVKCDAVPRPQLTYVEEVLVKVCAASVSPLDAHLSTGRGHDLCNNMRPVRSIPTGNEKEFPIILGRDFSGVVEKVGSKVSKVKAGDEVWGAVPFYSQGGGMAEYIVVSEADISKKPKGVTHQEASTFPWVACTVWCSLVRTAIIGAKRTRHQRVLITGCTSDVGTFAVQLIKSWGGHVTASCQDKTGETLIKSLGADEVVNISKTDLESSLIDKQKFDVIIDTVGPPMRDSCFKLCAKDGYFVSFVSPVLDNADRHGVMIGSFVTRMTRMKLAWRHGCNFSWSFCLPEGKILDRIARYVEGKKIRPVVDQIYRVDEAKIAFRHVVEGPTRGKTVITFDGSRQ